jgi:hypothetical protein
MAKQPPGRKSVAAVGAARRQCAGCGNARRGLNRQMLSRAQRHRLGCFKGGHKLTHSVTTWENMYHKSSLMGMRCLLEPSSCLVSYPPSP